MRSGPPRVEPRPHGADPLVEYHHQDGASRITLNRPGSGNAITGPLLAELVDAVGRARGDQARLIVLAARGPHFCVGGDLRDFAAAPDLAAHVDGLADQLHRAVAELVRSPAPVLAVVHGPAAGAGVSLAAAADIVVASDAATFTMAYGSVGLTQDGGASMLVHTLGLHRVLRMTLLDDVLTAEAAHQAGLVARVVPAMDLPEVVQELAERLLHGPRNALAASKALIRQTAEPAPAEVMHREALAIRGAASLTGREGVLAFLDKRRPRYRD